jgi:hypothetical protein
MSKFLRFLLGACLIVRLAPFGLALGLGLLSSFVLVLLGFVNYAVRSWGW